MKLTRRKFFLGAAAAAVVAPFLAVLPSRAAGTVNEADMWNGEGSATRVFGPIMPGHGGYVEVWPGKMTWVDNQTSEPMSREPWVEAFPN